MATADLPLTLFEIAGARFTLPDLAGAVLVLIDYQNEYLAGPLALKGAFDAVDRAAELLWAVREAGGRVIHVVHAGAPDGLFDRGQYRGAVIASVRPVEAEAVVEKTRPNGFSGTELADLIGEPGGPVIFAGFMTHNCLSSTARAALDLGYSAIVAGDACATRDLPADGGVIQASDLHHAELAALADRHAWVRDVSELIPARAQPVVAARAQIRGH